MPNTLQVFELDALDLASNYTVIDELNTISGWNAGTLDISNYRGGGGSVKLSPAAGTTVTATKNLGSVANLAGYSMVDEIRFWVYIDDATRFSRLALRLTDNQGSPVTAETVINNPIATGWNRFSLPKSRFTAPATLSGFQAYRQCPTLGLNRNLVVNGGLINGQTAWNVEIGGGNVGVVTDPTSVTGWAIRSATTSGAGVISQIVKVEPGKTYSAAIQIKGNVSTYGYLWLQWLDATGNTIVNTFTSSVSAAVWTETTISNMVAPGNATSVRLACTNDFPGVIFFTAVRLIQQSTAPAAWNTAQQVVFNKGLEIYEAGTNIILNGNFESTLSGTVSAFNDPFTDGNAWTPTLPVAANIATPVNGTIYVAGHPEWWMFSTNTQFRFKWVTGATVFIYVRYVDATNWLRYTMDGTNFYVQKMLAGTLSTIGSSQTGTLVNGNFYWVTPQMADTLIGPSLLINDNAGAPSGSTVATHPQFTDTTFTKGALALRIDGAAGTFGGAFSNVCSIRISAPPNWLTGANGGVPAFCVSKATKFSGAYSLSIYHAFNWSAFNNYWQQVGAVAITGGVPYTLSVRMKQATAGGYLAFNDGSGETLNGFAGGTNDWQPIKATKSSATVTASGGVRLYIGNGAALGTVWFDNTWLAQQAYDTGNSDLSAQAYTTGARTVSALTLPTPSGYSFNDGGALVVVRLDHAAMGTNSRIPVEIAVDGNNRIGFEIDPTAVGVSLFGMTAGGGYGTSTIGGTFAAGDTMVMALRRDTVNGIKLWVSVNGGAVATTSSASAPAKAVVVGTPTFQTGFTGAFQINGTIGVIRIFGPGTSDATINALVLDPYSAPTPNSLAYWNFDGYPVAQVGNAAGILWASILSAQLEAVATSLGTLNVSFDMLRMMIGPNIGYTGGVWDETHALADVIDGKIMFFDNGYWSLDNPAITPNSLYRITL